MNDKDSRLLSLAEGLARMGSWRWELKSDTLVWSHELYRIYGLKPGTPLSFDRFVEQIHPDDRDRVRQIVTAAIKEHKPFHYQERIVQPGGHIRVLDSQGDVDIDEKGNVVAMFGFCRDITEETDEHRRVLQLERHFAQLFHASPVAKCLTTARDGRFLDVNSRFLELTGYTKEELIGKTRSIVEMGESAADRDRYLEAVSIGESLRQIPITYTNRNGQKSRALASIESMEIGGEQCLLTLLWRS